MKGKLHFKFVHKVELYSIKAVTASEKNAHTQKGTSVRRGTSVDNLCT